MALVALMLIAPYALATCNQGTPTARISLAPVSPGDDGLVTATLSWSFPRPHVDYSQRVELWVEYGTQAGGGVFRYSADTITEPVVHTMDLGCTFGTKTIRIYAISQEGCVVNAAQSVTMDATPSGSFEVTSPNADGFVVPTIHYSFPYTTDNNYSLQAARWWLLGPNDKWWAIDAPVWYLDDEHTSRTLDPIMLACQPSGDYLFTLSLRGCSWVDTTTTLSFQPHPEAGVNIVNTGPTTRRAEMNYKFPYTPNYYHINVNRKFRLTIRDAQGTVRISDTYQNINLREGFLYRDFDTACWPEGQATVSVEAFGCGSETGTGTGSFMVDDGVSVQVAMYTDTDGSQGDSELDIRNHSRAREGG